MNIYVPIINGITNTNTGRPQLMPNPSERPRKVEIWVSINSNLIVNEEHHWQYINWHTLHDGVGAALETRLGMNLFSFRVLKGKSRPFVGKYTLLDRRGYGKRQVRLLAEHLKRVVPGCFAPQSFGYRGRGTVTMTQTPFMAVIGGRFQQSRQALEYRREMLDVSPTLLVRKAA